MVNNTDDRTNKLFKETSIVVKYKCCRNISETAAVQWKSSYKYNNVILAIQNFIKSYTNHFILI